MLIVSIFFLGFFRFFAGYKGLFSGFFRFRFGWLEGLGEKGGSSSEFQVPSSRFQVTGDFEKPVVGRQARCELIPERDGV
jgi:hypothetical protein